MKGLSLNTNNRTFAVKLRWRLIDSLFICQSTGLIESLKTDDQEKKGIEYIKEFDPAKCRFVKVSKDSILQLFSWDTESSLYLQNHYYFKK